MIISLATTTELAPDFLDTLLSAYLGFIDRGSGESIECHPIIQPVLL
jgi:hypothetical protein